jgi:hypothetical protein
LAPLCAFAQKTNNAGWHFPVALTYSAGFKDVSDGILGNVATTDKINIPFGLSFSPYYSSSNGIGFGADVGPFMFVYVDVRGGSSSNDGSALLMPLGLYCRYDFVQDGAVSPYVRGGIRHCFTSGELVDSSTTGFYGNVGVEFSRKRAVSFGLEAGFDTTKIDVFRYNSSGYLTTTTKEVKPYKFTVSAFVSF